MTVHTASTVVKCARITAMALLAMSCAADRAADGPCVPLPCPLELAAIVTVTSSVSSVTPSDISFDVHGESSGTCSGGTCLVGGGPGTYQVDISAPGFTTAHLTFTATGSSAAKCGCGTTNTQQLGVALVPAS